MVAQGLTKTTTARRMKLSRTRFDRFPDPATETARLDTLQCAAFALGRALHFSLE